MTKWPLQKQTQRTTQKHVEHQDETDLKKKHYFFVFFGMFFFLICFSYNFLNDFMPTSRTQNA